MYNYLILILDLFNTYKLYFHYIFYFMTIYNVRASTYHIYKLKRYTYK